MTTKAPTILLVDGDAKSEKAQMASNKNERGTVLGHWPLVAALVIFGLTVTRLFLLCQHGEGGHFSYVCDDVYIHMAVARNFARHGVWGVTRYGFSSSTSSIIWPLTLSAIYAVLGPRELAPFLLSLSFSVLAVVLAYAFLRRSGTPPGFIVAALLGMVFFAPLPWLVFSGMEHALQIATAIPFLYLAADELARKDTTSPSKASSWLWILTPILTLTRFEGLFLAFGACLLFLLRKRWRLAFGLGALAIAPVAVYGLVSHSKGWFWLPNSVVVKADVPRALTAHGFLQALGHGNFAWSGRTIPVLGLLVTLVVLLALLLYRRRAFWQKTQLMVALVIITICLHLEFTRVGFFFRYEAYLIALSLFVLAPGVYQYFRSYESEGWGKAETFAAAVWIVYVFLVPSLVLSLRAIDGLRRIPQASRNNYDQQYQMGLFLGDFYRGQSVALNDIGATSYFGEPRLEDLWGLGSLDTAKQMARGSLTPQQIEHLATGASAKIAILHEAAFRNGIIAHQGLPPQWKRAGQWTIPDNYICANATVTFFAIDPAEEARLIASLRGFSSRLPPGVTQNGLYTQSVKVPANEP